MKKSALYIILFSFLSCSSVKEEMKKNDQFKTIYESSYGGNESNGYEIIESEDKLKKELLRLNVPNEIIDTLEIDFKKNVVLILHLGEKNTGGYGIIVENIQFENETLIVQSKKTFPEKGGYVTMALTNPFCVTIIPKAAKYIVE